MHITVQWACSGSGDSFCQRFRERFTSRSSKGAVFKADQWNQLLRWFKLKHMCSGNPLQAKRWGSFLGRQYIIFKENPKENSLIPFICLEMNNSVLPYN